MKENIKVIFENYNLFEKAKNYISDCILTDKQILKDIFEIDNVDKNIDLIFKLATYGIDICIAEPEYIRYKLSYSVYLNKESINNYYIFFDKDGKYLDDFFDI